MLITSGGTLSDVGRDLGLVIDIRVSGDRHQWTAVCGEQDNGQRRRNNEYSQAEPRILRLRLIGSPTCAGSRAPDSPNRPHSSFVRASRLESCASSCRAILLVIEVHRGGLPRGSTLGCISVRTP